MDFAKKNYEHVVYLNFLKIRNIYLFFGSLEIDYITMLLSDLTGREVIFEEEKTIQILDGLQDCPNARTY